MKYKQEEETTPVLNAGQKFLVLAGVILVLTGSAVWLSWDGYGWTWIVGPALILAGVAMASPLIDAHTR